MMEENKIRVLVVEPNKKPYEKMVGTDLKSLQEIVEGRIEFFDIGEEGIIGYCNEEGKMEGLPLNRPIPKGDIIAGTFLLCADNGEGGEDSLSDEQIEMLSLMFEVKVDYRFVQAEDAAYASVRGADSLKDFMREFRIEEEELDR